MKYLGLEVEDKEEDEVAIGRQLCGGDSSAMIGMYPMLTPDEYNWTLFKIIWVLILTLVTPLHAGSLVYAIRGDEQDLALENASLGSMVGMYLCIYWLLVYRRSTMKDLFQRIGSGLYRYTTPLPDTKTSLAVDRYDYLLRLSRYYALMSCFLSFTMLPGVKIFLSGKITTENDGGKYPFNKNLPIQLFVPYKTDTHFTYWTTFVLETTVANFAALIISSTCNIYLGLNFQIWTQLESLKQSIESIGERASDLFEKLTGLQAADHINTKEFQDCLAWCLKENVQHHIEIIKFFRKFEGLFFDWLFFEFLASGFTVCVTIYRVENIDFTADVLILMFDIFRRLMILNFGLFPVIVYCLVGQKTTNLSHDLHEALYGCNWYMYCNKDFSMIVTVSLAISNRPFVISRFGMVPANAETLVNIMKSTFSLLNFVHFLIG